MAVLKKGSKGNPVKDIQKLLNKNGAKPALEVDGDFGPKTDAATKAFQKKMKIKCDGKVGDTTKATLDYGKPLPKLTVSGYSKVLAGSQKATAHNNGTIKTLKNLSSELEKLSGVFRANVPQAAKLIESNLKHRKEVQKLAELIASYEKMFAKLVLVAPDEAAKVVVECAQMAKQIQAIRDSKISPNLKTAAKYIAKAGDQMGASKKVIDAANDELTRDPG